MNRVDTLALCWRIERSDGAGLALTSHDRPVTLEGTEYAPSPGLLPASVKRRGGLTANSADIEGSISSEALTETDLALGRWSGAAIRLDALSWDDEAKPAVSLMSGEIGEVAVRDKGFSAELIGPAAKLDKAVCPATSSECRASLGDRQCRVDMAGRRTVARVTEITGNGLVLDPAASPGLAGGRMIVLDGRSAGWSTPIVNVIDSSIVLRDVPHFLLEAGTRVWVEEGYDRRFATCRERFGNQLNFRGEPYLPGNDLLTRYPGG